MTYTIGRGRTDMPNGIKIPNTATAVSSKHITVTDNGDQTCTVELCDSAEGLWLVNDIGQKTAIQKKRVPQNLVLRLGTEMGIQGFSLPLCSIFGGNQNWAQKFNERQQELMNIGEEQERLEQAKSHHQLLRTLSPIIGLIISVIPIVAEQYWSIRAAIVLPPLLCGLIFRSDDQKIKDLKIKRKNVCHCPRCKEEIPEQSVKKGQCPHCGAS